MAAIGIYRSTVLRIMGGDCMGFEDRPICPQYIPRRRAVPFSVTVDKPSSGGRGVGGPGVMPVRWMTEG